MDDDLHGYYFEDLKEGMTASFGKTITEGDIYTFAGVSGDLNPVHVNEEFAKTTMFKGRIAHGMIGAAFISAVLGTKLPGPGCIYVKQDSKFKAPVKIGDTLMARVTIKKLIPEKKFAECETICTVGDKKVIEGEALVMVPARGWKHARNAGGWLGREPSRLTRRSDAGRPAGYARRFDARTSKCPARNPASVRHYQPVSKPAPASRRCECAPACRLRLP